MKKLWLIFLICHASNYVVACSNSLLDSSTICENINILQKMRLRKRSEDKIFLVLEKLSNNKIKGKLIFGRYSHTTDSIDENEYYTKNSNVRLVSETIIKDVLRKICHNDLHHIRLYSLAYLKEKGVS